MMDQPTLFPELDPVSPEPVDVDAIINAIAKNASTPQHRQGIDDAYDRPSAKHRLEEQSSTQDVQIPEDSIRPTIKVNPSWRVTEAERQAGRVGVKAAREALNSN